MFLINILFSDQHKTHGFLVEVQHVVSISCTILLGNTYVQTQKNVGVLRVRCALCRIARKMLLETPRIFIQVQDVRARVHHDEIRYSDGKTECHKGPYNQQLICSLMKVNQHHFGIPVFATTAYSFIVIRALACQSGQNLRYFQHHIFTHYTKMNLTKIPPAVVDVCQHDNLLCGGGRLLSSKNSTSIMECAAEQFAVANN